MDDIHLTAIAFNSDGKPVYEEYSNGTKEVKKYASNGELEYCQTTYSNGIVETENYNVIEAST